MRVSAVAYIAQNIQEVEKLAVEVTEVTHNHPEGIKGAVVIATCIYMALHGSSRKEIGIMRVVTMTLTWTMRP